MPEPKMTNPTEAEARQCICGGGLPYSFGEALMDSLRCKKCNRSVMHVDGKRKDLIAKWNSLYGMPTEAEVRTATGDELNRLVHLHCLGDDLSCFNPDGSERVERIVECLEESWVWDGPEAGYYQIGNSQIVPSEFDLVEASIWQNRHGKPYQSDLEAHIQNWRAHADDYQGDMNLAEKLWCEEIEQISKTGNTYFVDSTDPHDGLDVWSDSLAVAICRAAVILAIREKARNDSH